MGQSDPPVKSNPSHHSDVAPRYIDPDEPLPALRPIDVVAFRDANHGLQFAMRDLSGIAERPIAISLAGYFIAAHLDGAHSARRIQSAFQSEFGAPIDVEQILRVVEALDRALLLRTPRFEREYASRRVAFRSAAVRDSRRPWRSADELRAEIRSGLAGGMSAAVPRLRAIIAPHLDYARGSPCYADAYATLCAITPAPRRFVIIGTNHFGHALGVVATRKDFRTPLGTVTTDRDAIDALERDFGAALCDDEYDHVAEHSVELHVHVLQTLFPDSDFTIVPIITPDPLAELDAAGDDEGRRRSAPISHFADCLGRLIASDSVDTILIASADLSHVGQRFGEPQPTNDAFMREVESRDRDLLDRLERDADEFLAAAHSTRNSTRVCSLGNLYVVRRALRGCSCRVLRYHQALDYPNETHVTCAAGVMAD